MILFLLDDTDHLYPQFWQVRIDTFQICHMIPADVVTRLHAIDLFRMTKPFFFFSRARRRAAYLCIKKKRVSNLHHRSPTLGQNGWRLNKTHKRLLQKKIRGRTWPKHPNGFFTLPVLHPGPSTPYLLQLSKVAVPPCKLAKQLGSRELIHQRHMHNGVSKWSKLPAWPVN